LEGEIRPFTIYSNAVRAHAEADVVSDQGDILNARYLFNPDNGAFVPVLDLGDDEFVSSGEVAFWERRLGITIPKPPV
jgi:hypothetical protein